MAELLIESGPLRGNIVSDRWASLHPVCIPSFGAETDHFHRPELHTPALKEYMVGNLIPAFLFSSESLPTL